MQLPIPIIISIIFKRRNTSKHQALGINFKMGMIFKPVEYVRLGLAVHTPTFYTLEDRYSTQLQLMLKDTPAVVRKHNLQGILITGKW